MKQCTFPRITAILRANATAPYRRNQYDLVTQIFSSYINDKRGEIELTSVSKWVTGARAVSGNVVDYYSSPKAIAALQQDIRDYVIPALLDADLAVSQLCTLVQRDTDMSPAKQQQLLYHALIDPDAASFIVDLVIYAINRPR